MEGPEGVVTLGIPEGLTADCIKNCPQVRACVSRAVIAAAYEDLELREALDQQFSQSRENGELPINCEKGPRNGSLSTADVFPGAVNKNVDESVIVSFFHDRPMVRMCEVDYI